MLVRLCGRVVDDRRERFVFDLDELCGILGDVAALGDHQGNRITHEAHLSLGKRRTRGLRALSPYGGVPLLPSVGIQVRRGEDVADAGQRCGGFDIDAAQPGTWMRAPGKARMEHPRKRDVVDIRATTGQEAWVLDARDARPYVAGGASWKARISHACRVLVAEPPATGKRYTDEPRVRAGASANR